MDEQLFKLVRDFYVLRREYEINMQQLQQQLDLAKRERERLRNSFNDLRDVVEELSQK